MTSEERAHRAKGAALGLGFDLAGIATLGAARTAPHLHDWLARGYHGEMQYLERGAALREDTTLPEPGMRSAIVVAADYGGKQPSGTMARYARSDDYHDVLRARLRELHATLERDFGAFAARPYVDTGPILERDLAQRAGLGWFGKNTMLINPQRGSFFFLAALFTSLDLAPDAPFASDHCGTCTRCLEACPTGAFVAPRVMDATKCISYLTIEHRSAIPEELRTVIGDHVFGCDICQDVCPWNQRFASPPTDAALAPRDERIAPDPADLLALDDTGFRSTFRGSAVTRTKRRGLARNAAVALGNRGGADAIAALERAAVGDPDPLVREHAAWGLERARRGT
ncbi:MAG TPA: tRNA epoxyqueuosine(34) reductase QueG [Gemmatimonadaceae bacterium]|nr:tRNA epoxyqueuosine(34) reductase QueG [Gemmatimonadaceae bacterium]